MESPPARNLEHVVRCSPYHCHLKSVASPTLVQIDITLGGVVLHGWRYGICCGHCKCSPKFRFLLIHDMGLGNSRPYKTPSSSPSR